MIRGTKAAEILCPVCGSGKAGPLFTKEGRTFSRCSRCRLIFRESPAPFESTAEFYEKNYYESFGDRAPVIQAARLSIYDDFLAESASCRRNGRLLDIGAGHGEFLRKAEAAGWEGWGIEPSQSAARASRDFLGPRVLNQTVEEADFPADHFDVITLWNVIDCLADPVESLKKIRTWLRPGGLLLIRTPNASFHWGIYRIYSRFRPLLENIGWKKEASVFLRSNFNSGNLKALLEDCGFSRVRIQNGRPTEGDAYRVFRGPFFMQTAKSLLFFGSRLIEFLTAGRLLAGSNLIARASKSPHSNPLPRRGRGKGEGEIYKPAVRRRIIMKRSLLRFLAALGYLLGFPLWFKLLGKDREIAVLRYHSVNEFRGSDVNVRESEFRKQLDFLKTRYDIIPLEKAVEFLEKGALPERGAVALTFDDGYRDNYEIVFPVLAKEKIPATVFLLAGGEERDRVLPHLQDDQPEYSHLLNWEEAREMADSGITFGSHGESHARLVLLPRERAEFEIMDSRKKIEREIRRPIQFFSYPYGTFLDFDSKTERWVEEAGYQAAFSAVFGTNGPRSRRFALRRIGIEASDTLFTFRAKLNGALMLLSIFDLPWMRKTVRWLNRIFLGPGKKRPCLLVSVDFPPHTDGVSTLSRELCARIAGRGVPLLALGPRDRGAKEFDGRQSYGVIRVPGYEWGYLRFLPLLLATPVVVFRHGVRKIFAMNIAYGGILSWALSFLKPLEYLTFAYGYEFEKVKRNPLLRKLYLSIYRRSVAVAACSKLVKEKLVQFGVEGKKIHVLYPAVDTEKYRPTAVPGNYLEEKGLKGKKILLSVGRLIERKGHDRVLRALPRMIQSFPEVFYAIVGIGPYERNLREEVRRLKLEDHVRFFGRVPEEELNWLYNACDLFVMPSREIADGGHIEGFGIVYLEANACAKPVIGGRSGGVVEAVRDGETGFLVDPERPGEIAEKALYLLSHPKEAQAMGERGLQWVRETFDWERYTDQALGLLC